MRVLFFGDSVTQGFWDLEYGGWVQRVRRDYDKQSVKNLAGRWFAFFNLGVDGGTTDSVVRRLSSEVESRRFQDDPYALVFQVGLNDTIFVEDEVMATPEQYRDELDVLISAARHYSDKILFIGLTPVEDKLCNPWPHTPGGICLNNERILQFEEVLRKVCIEKEMPCVQIFEKFQVEQGKHELLADGLHPNDAGHQLIADLVRPQLDALINT